MAPEGIPEPKAWSLVHWLIAGMGAVIILLLTLNLAMMRESDQTVVHQIAELRTQLTTQLSDYNKIMTELAKRVIVLEVNQQARLDRERMENEYRLKMGLPKRVN